MDIGRVIAWALERTPVRAFLRYSERRGAMLADSVTYRSLFSIFAGVLLGFSVAALWLAGNPDAWQALIDAVNRAVPGLVGPDGLISVDAISAPAGLSIAGAIAAVGLIGAAIRAMCDETTDDVPFWLVMLRNLALAVGVGGALLASAVATMLGTAGLGMVAGWLGLGAHDPLITWGSRTLAIVVTFLLDAVAIAVVFRVLSGVKASAKALWTGALLGAVGLTVLQQLSGLFVGGATSNPLLATFASLIALLLWINLSSQVILIACAYIYTLVREDADRVRERFGATTFAERRVKQAEDAVSTAATELDKARTALADERAKPRDRDDARHSDGADDRAGGDAPVAAR